jgi:uncharacterized protein YndB with AHSA1/START domain
MSTVTTYTHSTTIDVPVEEAFAFLRDPARFANGMPHTSTADTPPPPAEVGTTFTWRGQFLGMHVTATLEYTQIEPNTRVSLTSSKGFVFDVSVEPTGAGTLLTLSVRDVPANRLESAVDAVAMRLTDGDLDRWLAAIKSELETGVPADQAAGKQRGGAHTITVHAPVEQVFAYLADPATAFGAFPDTRVSDVHREPQGVGSSCRWHGRVLGLPGSVTHTYTEVVPNERIVSTASAGFVVTWTLEPADGGTRLTVTETAAPTNPVQAVVDPLILRFAGRDMERWLTGVAHGVEGGEG